MRKARRTGGQNMFQHKATQAARATRLMLTCLLVLSAAMALVWYGTQFLEARRSTAELESQWRGGLTVSVHANPRPGDVVGRIAVPRLGLDTPMVEMADVDDMENLNKGPAHIAGTALPGAAGNCVIAGHRTTQSKPFLHLDTVAAGDEVLLTDLGGIRHRYLVTGSEVVDPDDVRVMDPTPQPSLTLIACHPPFSARYRLVVKAALAQ